ncbi:hypothetical protein G7Z17_g1065 [Cylindrodendrum hubeiense]|uniref:NACHT-NTPase and P-loop NTPases N-terminal domain-containing protein n=1 Tax=Cylindrodendrum hubeiense TaxID=595255 RepID=A0A9P5HMB4_9HYPO|nr:hypothetical protein G7Z17_g1065 [Cylindrodendrum hubeiense]
MDPLSITAATIAIIQSISSTFDIIKHLKGLPKAFKEVGQSLPLVREILELAHSELQATAPDESVNQAIEPVINSCQEKAKALSDIFDELYKAKKHEKDAKEWSAFAIFYRKTVLRVGKSYKVETLMKDLLNSLKALAIHQLFKMATQGLTKKLENAIKKLSEVEPSLPDSDFEIKGTNVTQNISDSGKAGAGKTVLASIIINHLQTFYPEHGNTVCIYIYFDYEKQQAQSLENLLSSLFLLAHLHMEFLASIFHFEVFKTGLAQLPTTPDQVYKTALQRISEKPPEFRELASNVLTWLVFAERPLTVDELKHVIAIQGAANEIQARNLALPTVSLSAVTESVLTSACAGIVVVDKKSKSVRLAHDTADKYLRNSPSTDFQNAQSTMAEACLLCLTNIPHKQFNKAPPKQGALNGEYKHYPFFNYAAEYWGNHLSLGVKGEVYKLAWEFLSDTQKLNSALRAMDNPQFRHDSNVSGTHIAAYFGLVNLVQKAIKRNRRLDINAQTKRGETPLHWAAIHRQREFLEFLVIEGADLNVVNVDKRTALHMAIMGKTGADALLVKVLLSTGRVNLNLEDSQGWTPLRWATAHGQLKIVEMLLRAEAEVDARDKDGWTALRWAAHRGHKIIVKLLIRHEASIETPSSDQWTLLRWAAQEGREDIIRLLVEMRVNLNATGVDGLTPLRWAVDYDRTITAWLLIQAHADINKPDNKGMTPLHSVAKRCRSSMSPPHVLWLLLESQADINAQTKLGLTPLHLAASGGNESAVWLLLEKGADPKRGDFNNRTALHWAIEEEHMKVAQLLISKAEDLVHAVDHEKRTALHCAASLGNTPMVEMLLKIGAHINTQDSKGQTPLHLAVSQQHEAVVNYLAWRGADVNILNKKKRTAVQLAATVGNDAIIMAIHPLHQDMGANVGVEHVESPASKAGVKRSSKAAMFSARVEDE